MALEVKNLSITIGKTDILSNQSVGIADGSKIGLIGRNGVGKTTFLKAILKNIQRLYPYNYNTKFKKILLLCKDLVVLKSTRKTTMIG